MPPARAWRFFLSYVEKINALKAHPEFYNTLLTNCPTNRVRVTAKELRDGWKVALMEM